MSAGPVAEIRLVDPGGSEKVVDHIRSKQMRTIGEMWKARLTTDRTQVAEDDLSEGDTRVYLSRTGVGDVFGGRFRRAKWSDETVELMVDSPERDAKQAKPTGPGTGDDRFENAQDTAIIEDAVGRVDSLSAGDLEDFRGGLSFRFSYVPPARMVRTVTDVAGEVAYRPDWTVDYAQQLGDDLTDITLEQGGDSLDGPFRVDQGDNDVVTHLRMLGSGEGPSQVQVDVVSDSFTQGEDRPKWAVYVNKDLGDEDTATEAAEVLLARLEEPQKTVNTTVRGREVAVGDRYHILSDEKNVDHDMRAVRVDTIIDDDGRRHDVRFSTWDRTAESVQQKLVKDVRRAGTVVEGFTVPLPVSSGPDPVSSAKAHRFRIPMPSDVIKEVGVVLQVSGLEEYVQSDDTFTGSYPADVDVLVNGSSLGLSLGDGSSAFVEDVDLSGALVHGAINTIDITSSSKGRTYAVLAAELYRSMSGA